MPNRNNVTLLDSLVPREEPADQPAFRVVSLDVGGTPHAAAVLDAVLDRYAAHHHLGPFDADALAAHAGTRVTVVTADENMFGSRRITARPGRVVDTDRGPALLGKGARTHGIRLSDPSVHVVDVVPGYDTTLAQDRVDAVRDTLPTVGPLTPERLRALPAGSDDCTLGVLVTLRLPDGRVPGCVWLLTGYDPDDDVADGMLVVPDGRAFSEHGSVRGEDLVRTGGAFELGVPVPFADAIRLDEIPYADALARVTGRTPVSA